jgi:hypothetical protein
VTGLSRCPWIHSARWASRRCRPSHRQAVHAAVRVPGRTWPLPARDHVRGLRRVSLYSLPIGAITAALIFPITAATGPCDHRLGRPVTGNGSPRPHCLPFAQSRAGRRGRLWHDISPARRRAKGLLPQAWRNINPTKQEQPAGFDNEGPPRVPLVDNPATMYRGRDTAHILRPVWTQIRLHEILSPMRQARNRSSVHPNYATIRILPRLR